MDESKVFVSRRNRILTAWLSIQSALFALGCFLLALLAGGGVMDEGLTPSVARNVFWVTLVAGIAASFFAVRPLIFGGMGIHADRRGLRLVQRIGAKEVTWKEVEAFILEEYSVSVRLKNGDVYRAHGSEKTRRKLQSIALHTHPDFACVRWCLGIDASEEIPAGPPPNRGRIIARDFLVEGPGDCKFRFEADHPYHSDARQWMGRRLNWALEANT